MEQRRIRRINLPFVTTVIICIATMIEVVGIKLVGMYMSKIGMAERDIRIIGENLRTLSFFILFVGVVTFIIVSSLADKMYNRDALTQIANAEKIVSFAMRKFFVGKLSTYTGIFLNIKDFKYINSKATNEGGDRVLHDYAQSLMKFLGKKNYVGRLGGDNFFIYVRNDELDKFLNFVKAVPVTINSRGEDITFRLSPRLGIYPVQENDMHNTVINSANVALAFARRTGEDFVWFKPSMMEAIVAEKKLIADFEKSVYEDEFIVSYQPKVRLNNKVVCGAEALVSWHHDGEVTSPQRFVPVFEKYGKITVLDYYVLNCVCRDIKETIKQGITPVRVSINFSRVHLMDTGFGDKVLQIVDNYDIPKKYIEIEITESAEANDSVSLNFFIEEMKSAGIVVSIDDFGIGYSSLSMIKNMNFDAVKLDKSFIMNLDDKKQKVFVANIIHMLKALEFEVVCEGVESEEQADFLEINGCDIVQGFLYSEAVSYKDYLDILVAGKL